VTCNVSKISLVLSFLKSVTTLIIASAFFLGIANDGEAHSEKSLLQGLHCPPILQFPCAIVVPLIKEQCKHVHELVYN
jgi:hypothetical protein